MRSEIRSGCVKNGGTVVKQANRAVTAFAQKTAKSASLVTVVNVKVCAALARLVGATNRALSVLSGKHVLIIGRRHAAFAVEMAPAIHLGVSTAVLLNSQFDPGSITAIPLPASFGQICEAFLAFMSAPSLRAATKTWDEGLTAGAYTEHLESI